MNTKKPPLHLLGECVNCTTHVHSFTRLGGLTSVELTAICMWMWITAAGFRPTRDSCSLCHPCITCRLDLYFVAALCSALKDTSYHQCYPPTRPPYILPQLPNHVWPIHYPNQFLPFDNIFLTFVCPFHCRGCLLQHWLSFLQLILNATIDSFTPFSWTLAVSRYTTFH